MKKNVTRVIVLLASFIFGYSSMVTATETVVYSEGFEADNGGFVVSTSGASAGWQWGTPAASPGPGSAHSGAKCWGTNFGSQMPRPADESIVSRPIKLPQVSANQVIRVRFWSFVSLDGMYDRGQFFVSKDGQNWDSLAQFYNNMETNCAITPTWHKYEFTIDNSYAADPDPNNNVIYLKLRAAAQYASSTFYCPPYTADDLSGVYLDDVAITYYDIPSTKKVFSLSAWEDPSAWASCPWVAPWNGSRFQIDNDIYSVARMPENEYRDSYRLSVPLVAKNGVYPIEIQERESEDSYTDYVALLEIDHAPDVAVAPDAKGILHAYRPAMLVKPVSADANGTNVTSLLATADNKGVAAYSGDTITVDFGKVVIANGATLVLRVKGFVLGEGIPKAFSGTPAIVVETMDSNGSWQERGRLLPRFEFSVQAFDLKPYLTNGQAVKVRLRSVSHDVKFHLVDNVALYAGSAPYFSVAQVAPSKAVFGSQNVLGALLTADSNYVKLSPGDKISLEFPVKTLPNVSIREFVFISKGYYVPKSGSYLISTWDGANWVQRDGHSYSSSISNRDYDLSLFLPDPTGKYRVRIWQDYQYEGAGIDFVKMTVGGALAPLMSAFDNRTGTNVTSQLANLDGNIDQWSSCPRDRIVDVEFSGPGEIPPRTDPPIITDTNNPTPTICWSYYSPSGNPLVASDLQVWSGPGATGVIMWNPPLIPGPTLCVVYGGNPLSATSVVQPTNGLSSATATKSPTVKSLAIPTVVTQDTTPYYVRVRVSDGEWGPWSESSFTVTSQICGDLNSDGLVNSVDYAIFRSAIGKRVGQPGYNVAADMDGDGLVSLKDYSAWYACYIKFR
jgi:hypothetical protein